MKRAPFAIALLVTAGGAACVPDGDRTGSVSNLPFVLEAEDLRPTVGPELDRLVRATEDVDPRVRRAAVRALGRLERPALLDVVIPGLRDDDPGVRSAAAEALAQSVHGAQGAGVLEFLLERVDAERDATVLGAIARSIGRLDLEASDRRRAADALARIVGEDLTGRTTETLLGAALGYEALMRGADGDGLALSSAERLEAMAAFESPDSTDLDAGRIRALALSTLGLARRMTLEWIERAQQDPEPEARRAVLRYLSAVAPAERLAIVDRALKDPSASVVLEALRIVSSGARTTGTCAWLVSAAAPDQQPAVRVVALDALARPCPSPTAQRVVLRDAAADLPADESTPWQPAAHALLSLARIDLRAASQLIPLYAQHPNAFVRAYAAQVAAAAEDEATLWMLASDSIPNVRTAAIESFFSLRGHAVDNLLLDQLGADDPQLLMTVARLLADSPGRGVVAAALLVKLERISALRRETFRDSRRAIIERIGELGDVSMAPRLEPFLSDYDAVIADDVADILRRWTGNDIKPSPVPLPRAPLPDASRLSQLERTSVALHMRGGGTIVIRLLGDIAPRNAWRFLTLAESGYFDGLTFHRWVPNFVIQGGSPNANEYSGDGPFTRDEVGATHWRGTVGVSTRGRDTGDGQIFVNLVNNVALDPDYTVFGFVSEGMDVVESALEGAVIERAEVRIGSR